MSGVNEAFLREVLAFIELHPERWDQRTWADAGPCGTTHCLAGWAYNLASDDQIRIVAGVTVAREPIKTTAQELLGLTHAQAHDLFMFTVVVEDPVRGVARLPTFAELCAKVEEVTGVRFKPTPGDGDGD